MFSSFWTTRFTISTNSSGGSPGCSDQFWREHRNNGQSNSGQKPGGKTPLCTLTARELKAAGPRHGCGVHHAITDPVVARRVFTRMGKTDTLNIGIVAHPSRLVVVDVDTPEAVESFLSRWAQAEEDERYLVHSPTVRTPGTVDGKHHDGGHYYFALPDGIELPSTPGQLTLAGGGDVRWGAMMTVARGAMVCRCQNSTTMKVFVMA